VITAGVDQFIWIVTPGSSENATSRKIAAGHSAAISPRGDRIAFLRNSQIWLADLSGSDRSTLLYQARSGVTSSQPEWSPEGSKDRVRQRPRQP
jgi:Tol biopolymer transport system component